jgi:hypothetical protein
VVENRVKIGEDSWVVDFGEGSPIAEAGAVESIEIVNDSNTDYNVEGAGINNVSFITTFDGCTGILKAKSSCTVRGKWLTQNVREANLEVAVSAQNEKEGSTTERISVPLEPRSDTPSDRTLSPTLAASSEPPTPSQSPTPSPSPTITPTPQNPSPTRSHRQIPSVNPTRSN